MGPIHETIDIHIGKRIRLRREETKTSIEKLSIFSNISLANMCLIEAGKLNISAGQLFNISQVLQTNISYFFENDNEICRLIAAYCGIKNKFNRQEILNLIESINENLSKQ